MPPLVQGPRKILDGIRELGVEMTPTMTKEAEDMAYVGDAPYTQGLNEGFDKGMLRVAQKMIADGVPFETISKYTAQ